MKTDARVRLTRRLLREALLECMKKRQLKDITITEVCRTAEINRATFYKHYRNCYEIVEEVEQDQLEVFRTMLMERKKSGEELLRDILDSIDKAIELTGGEGGKMLPESFKDGLIRTTMECGVQAWKERIPRVGEHEAELAYEGLVAAALRMALSAGGTAHREVVVKTIMGMFNSYIRTHETNTGNETEAAK